MRPREASAFARLACGSPGSSAQQRSLAAARSADQRPAAVARPRSGELWPAGRPTPRRPFFNSPQSRPSQPATCRAEGDSNLDRTGQDPLIALFAWGVAHLAHIFLPLKWFRVRGGVQECKKGNLPLFLYKTRGFRGLLLALFRGARRVQEGQEHAIQPDPARLTAHFLHPNCTPTIGPPRIRNISPGRPFLSEAEHPSNPFSSRVRRTESCSCGVQPLIRRLNNQPGIQPAGFCSIHFRMTLTAF